MNRFSAHLKIAAGVILMFTAGVCTAGGLVSAASMASHGDMGLVTVALLGSLEFPLGFMVLGFLLYRSGRRPGRDDRE